MVKRSLYALILFLAVIVAVPGVAAASGSTVSAWQQEAGTAEKVDVNHANEEQLQRVPGIGPAMAQRIVDWRTEHGRFERLEDLLDIRGIGTKTLEKLRPYLTLGDEDDSGA